MKAAFALIGAMWVAIFALRFTGEEVQVEPIQENTNIVAPIVTPAEPSAELYDVPLDEELQLHIIRLCEVHGIDPSIVISVIRYESNYNPDAVGDDGDSIGLMQVQPRWHSDRMEQLGCTDLYDPYQNVTVGISILAEKLATYDTDGEALTAYNAGDYGAYIHYFGKGVYANAYAEKILAFAEELNKKG